MLSAIDTEDKLKAFLPVVDQMVQEGLVVLSDVDIVKYSWRATDQEAAPPVGEPTVCDGDRTMKEQFEARLLRIYFGESDKWQGKPLARGDPGEVPGAGDGERRRVSRR